MANERVLSAFTPRRVLHHTSLFSISRIVLRASLVPPSAAGELSIGIRAGTLPTYAFLMAKKKSSVLPPLSLRRAYRVSTDTQDEFLIKSWVYGHGFKVFIYVYLLLHAPWTHYLARSKYTLMQRLIRASGFSPRRKVSRSGSGTNSCEFLASGLCIVLNYENQSLDFSIFHLDRLLTVSNAN